MVILSFFPLLFITLLFLLLIVLLLLLFLLYYYFFWTLLLRRIPLRPLLISSHRVTSLFITRRYHAAIVLTRLRDTDTYLHVSTLSTTNRIDLLIYQATTIQNSSSLKFIYKARVRKIDLINGTMQQF